MKAKDEPLYWHLFENMMEGFAVHEIIVNRAGVPVDYRFLDVNPSFERITGLKAADIIGNTVRKVLPGIEPAWIEKYGKVALQGVPLVFEEYNLDLGKHFEVHAYRRNRGSSPVFSRTSPSTSRRRRRCGRKKNVHAPLWTPLSMRSS